MDKVVRYRVGTGCERRVVMDQGQHLLTFTLGLVPPWAVDYVRFSVEENRLDLHVNFGAAINNGVYVILVLTVVLFSKASVFAVTAGSVDDMVF